MLWHPREMMTTLGLALFLMIPVDLVQGQTTAPQDGAEPLERYSTAWEFLRSLDEDEQVAAKRSFNDPERIGWSFFPAKRKGLRIGDLDPEERGKLWQFLLAALGEHGVQKVTEVCVVEAVTERGDGVVTGPEEYYISFFGPVSRTEPWSWRLEGHHIALNQTIKAGEVLSSTPSFLGSYPLRNEDGLEPLRREIELAEAIVASLEGSDRKQVIIAEVPREVVTGMKATWDAPEREGVALADVPEPVREQMRLLANEHVSTHADDVVTAFQEKWKSLPPEKVHFAWFGPMDKSGPHGYRLHGPDWVMEYVNFQGGANHVHTVWRTHEGEFHPIASR